MVTSSMNVGKPVSFMVQRINLFHAIRSTIYHFTSVTRDTICFIDRIESKSKISVIGNNKFY